MSDSFTRVLQARRGYFNARFAEKQIANPNLDADAFLNVLRENVAPAVEAVAQISPDNALIAAQNLYDLALDLFTQGLLGSNAHSSILNAAWQEFLPALAAFIAQAPQRVPASVMNALHNLAQTPGAHPDEWMQNLRAALPFCADAETFLRAGQVAAWRAGMAHYRVSALAVLKTLDAKLARTLFGLDANAAQPDTAALHYALMANPWHDPRANLASSAKQTRIVKRAGSFRGFGGQFLAPPRVLWTREGFVAQDGENFFLLFADAFGATLHRAEKLREEKISSPFKLNRDGAVTANGATMQFPELVAATSFAANQTTLAVTADLTHAIYLLALV